ncbi:MAG: sulfite exporter TauE/SafE family protein [Candidatus Zixiibacteriota bacterium]|nr:MAG: sulfite exporter TauE/SafE family protein [candidate division Zixibacteria bacterium]
MTESLWIALGSSFWLGVLTSISPCPMATNIAAVTYIGKRVTRPSLVLTSGLVYTLGRMISYVVLAVVIVSSILAIPEVALFLQKYMNRILGPILILAGLFLLGVIRFKMPGFGVSDGLQKKVEKSGFLGAGLLGLIFALSFCPISAALYFGSLIPLAIDHQSAVLMPGVYGVGTALPAVVFSILIAFGARFVGAAFNCLRQFEFWARRVTGVIFLLVGVYYILIYIFGLKLL